MIRPDTGLSRLAAVLAGLVVIVGVLASLSFRQTLEAAQHRTAEQAMDRRTDLVVEAVAGETRRYADTVRTVAASAGASGTLTAAQFAADTAPLREMRLAGATSIAFVIALRDDEIAAAQAHWRARGATGLVLHPQGSGKEHLFAVFVQPLDGSAAPALGVDVTQAPAPSEAMAEARRRGDVTVSDTYQFLRDRDLPPERRQNSFVLAAPVYGPEAGGLRRFAGWVLMGLRGQSFTGEVIDRAAQGTVDVALYAENAAGDRVQVAGPYAGTAGADLRRVRDVPVGQRRWHLEVQARSATLPGGSGNLPTVVAVGGLALTLLLATLVFVLAASGARARAQVVRATAELRAAEREAREQAGLLAAIMESIGDGVGVVDEHGRFLLHNSAAKRLLAVDRDTADVDGWQSHYGIYRPDGVTPFPTRELPLVRALAGESTEQVEMVIRNAGQPQGIVISVSGRPLSDRAGRPGAVAVFHDITARKRAELEMTRTVTALALANSELAAARDELAARKAYLNDVLDAVDVAIVTTDAQGRVQRANRGAKEIAGTGELVELNAASLRASTADGRSLQGAADNPVRRAMAGETVRSQDIVVHPVGGGRPRTLLTTTRPLRDASGAVIGTVSAGHDVTTLRQHQADLAAFAGVVAHDLKAPLAIVGGYIELLGETVVAHITGQPVEVAKRSIGRIQAGVERMQRLIDDLLSYTAAREAPLNLAPVDLRALAEDSVRECGRAAADGPDIRIGPLPAVHADATLLRQVLDNLVGNALTYTPPGRPVRVEITASPDRDGWVRVEVADRGIGIPEGQHTAIFDRFHRAHPGYGGTGLGLAICRRIVERHGGEIGVVDNPGGGARFSFTVPAAEPAAEPVGATGPAAGARARG